MRELLIYLLLINLVTFFIMGFDKKRARQGGWRVPEKRLFLLAAAGGAIGGSCGMKVWRHKTKHSAFTVGFPLLIVFNIITFYLLAKWLTTMQ